MLYIHIMNSKELQLETSEGSNLTAAQLAAIKAVKSLSEVIASEHPEVADDYRSGLNQVEIASKYGLDIEVGIRIARGAVGKALQTLIPDEEERKKLARSRKIETGRKNGKKTFQEKRGIYSISPEEHSLRSSKAGKAARDAKKGIFNLTAAERKKVSEHANNCRTAEEKRQTIRKTLIKQGKIPWITDLIEPISKLNEVAYLLSLAKNPEYTTQSGPRKGCYNCIKIAAKLNEVFHHSEQVRTSSSISTYLSRLKNRKTGSQK